MSTLDLFFIGVGLSMDACAICLSNMLAYPRIGRSSKVFMPLLFGLFQGIMPWLGAYAGDILSNFINAYAGYVTFFVFCFIGGKMIIDQFYAKQNNIPSAPRYTLCQAITQAIATSLDAFVVGVGLHACNVSLQLACPLVALITFACCSLSVLLGGRFASSLGKKAPILGGILLILIGLKSLF